MPELTPADYAGRPHGGGPRKASPHRPVPGHGHSLSVGRVAGIPIRLHWSFFLLVAFFALVDSSSGARAVVSGLASIVALFSSVVAHEMAHSTVARRRGARVIGIVLFPLGGLSQLEAMPTTPGDELAVAVAGPLTSLILGLILLAAGVATGAHVWMPTLLAGSWWARLGWLNLLLGAFNLLPALPMDGGRVLRAVLEPRRGHLEATLLAGRVARSVGLALLVFGFLFDIWLLLIGLFVLLGARAEEEAARHPPPPKNATAGSPPRPPSPRPSPPRPPDRSHRPR